MATNLSIEEFNAMVHDKFMENLEHYIYAPSFEEDQIRIQNALNNYDFSINNGNLYHNNKFVANCTVTITKYIITESEEYYECDVLLKNKHIPVLIDIRGFTNVKWIQNITDNNVADDKDTLESLTLYLKVLSNTIDPSKITYIMKNSGWYMIDGKYFYLTPNGVIGIPELPYKAENGHKFSSLLPDVDGFRDYINLINITDSYDAKILVLFSALNLAKEIFEEIGLPVDHELYLEGYNSDVNTIVSALTHMKEPNRTKDDIVESEKCRGIVSFSNRYDENSENLASDRLCIDMTDINVNESLIKYIKTRDDILERFAVFYISCLTLMLNEESLNLIETLQKDIDDDRIYFEDKHGETPVNEYFLQYGMAVKFLMNVVNNFVGMSSKTYKNIESKFIDAINNFVNYNIDNIESLAE